MLRVNCIYSALVITSMLHKLVFAVSAKLVLVSTCCHTQAMTTAQVHQARQALPQAMCTITMQRADNTETSTLTSSIDGGGPCQEESGALHTSLVPSHMLLAACTPSQSCFRQDPRTAITVTHCPPYIKGSIHCKNADMRPHNQYCCSSSSCSQAVRCRKTAGLRTANVLLATYMAASQPHTWSAPLLLRPFQQL